MFVVSPATRVHVPADNSFAVDYPVVFENAEQGFVSTPVAHKGSRDEAQALADKLNDVLNG